MKKTMDIFIVGGGINGAAIAADAAGRGLIVCLAEKNDLSCGTSSASSKLIHGGLRYLEFYEFGLVRKALIEREVLLYRAPHLVSPLEFVLPHEKHLRPRWMIRMGLWLYDHLASRKKLPASKGLHLNKDERGAGLLPHLQQGFSYYDCFADDSRLVIANAQSARENGAEILTQTEFINAKRENNLWKIALKDRKTNETIYRYAKALFNVGGPWIKHINDRIENTPIQFEITLDKGSHFIVPKLYEGDFAYILQNSDQRIIFAIPFQKKYTLIGTTDVHFTGDLENIVISEEEIHYLCKTINQYFKKSIGQKDIIWSYAGVRCLQASQGHSDATTTRDFKYLKNIQHNTLLFTVIGGKLTTHRTLAEQALDEVKHFFPHMKQNWTATQPLPGGHFKGVDFQNFYHSIEKKYPALPKSLLYRYSKNYGTLIEILLKNKQNTSALGKHFGHGLYQVEVEYLIQHEWAKSSADILWRRTKLGLDFSEAEIQILEAWINEFF